MPMNHRAKFDAASFIVGGEICNHKKSDKQTVNNISTPCLSACVDNKISAASQTTISSYCADRAKMCQGQPPTTNWFTFGRVIAVCVNAVFLLRRVFPWFARSYALLRSN